MFLTYCDGLNEDDPHRLIGSDIIGGVALFGVSVALWEEVYHWE